MAHESCVITPMSPGQRYFSKKVLVTGGAGFIGAHLVCALTNEGARVTVLDDLFTGDFAHLHDIACEKIHGSVCTAPLVEELVMETDYIFHLAARNIIASTKNPREDLHTNIYGTFNILMATKRFPVVRVVYTSSASVYGNPKYLPINEDDTINLLTPYAVSKFSGEGYCLAFYESYRLPVTVLRLSNVYGPNQSTANPYCGVVAKFMHASINNLPMEIHGDGSSTRDFTYVEDVVEALLLAGLYQCAEGEVFNVATGVETSINELANKIVELERPTHDSPIWHVDRRDIDNIRRRVLNIEKIRRKLGWTPRVPLQDGLRLTQESIKGKTICADTSL